VQICPLHGTRFSLTDCETAGPDGYQHTGAARSGENGGGVSILIQRDLGTEENCVTVECGIECTSITTHFDNPLRCRRVSPEHEIVSGPMLYLS
jgi:hypothetical protein